MRKIILALIALAATLSTAAQNYCPDATIVTSSPATGEELFVTPLGADDWDQNARNLSAICRGEATPKATALPGTCSVGTLFFDMDATAGLNLYGCTSADTWTLLGDGGGSGSLLTVREEDGSPSVASVTELRVSNGTLTDNTGGSVSITTGGGGGGGSNSFETITPSSGTAPVADSAMDILTVTGTAPITVTGSAAADSLTLALTQHADTDITADLEEETHAAEHHQGGGDAISAEALASVCAAGETLEGDGAGGVQCGTDDGGVGSSDHGTLTGLADDDHPQYTLLAGRGAAAQEILGGLEVEGGLEATSPGRLVLRDTVPLLEARGGVQVQLEFPEATTENVEFRFFRSTNTSGSVSLVVKSGNGTNTNQHLLRSRGSSSLAADNNSLALVGGLGSFGGGDRVVFIGNAGTNPSTNPTGGGVLYSDAGDASRLKWRRPDGTVDVVGVAGVGGALDLIYVRDQKSSGQAGGAAAAATWNVRTLNTVTVNTISGASLASNRVTLPAGTYRIRARAPAYLVGRHKLRLRNITAGSTAAVGSSAYADATTGAAVTDSVLLARITLASTTELELQHFTTSARATHGLGIEVSSSEVEVYTEMWIEKE